MKFQSLWLVLGLWLLPSFEVLSQERQERIPSSNGINAESAPSPEDASEFPEPLDEIEVVENSADPSESHVVPQPTEVTAPGLPIGALLNEAQQADLRADCAILKAMYSTTNGIGWVKKDGWDSPDTLSCCSWYGITCNKSGRVKGVRLPANDVSGSIPPEVGQLSGLLTLDLSRNQLSGRLPESLGALSSLLSMNLDGNSLGGAIGDFLGGMSSLQSLHLRNNSFTSLPASLNRLTYLRGLFLSNNQFADIIPPVIFQIGSLEILALDYNQLRGGIPEDIGNLAKLRSLYLRHNMLDGPLPEGLSRCTELRTISISYNKFQGNIPASYTGLANMISLDMSHNRLIGSIPSNIGELKNLERLYLSQNQLVGPVPDSLGGLERLQRLAIHFNALNSVFPDIPSPRNLTFCRVQPNPLNGCPTNDRISDRSTLAFQCHLDCSAKSINAVVASGSTAVDAFSYIAWLALLVCLS